MCKVTFSCGHRALKGEDGVDVAIKAQDREGLNSIEYEYVCPSCYEWLRNVKLLLDTEYEMDKWMRGKYEE